MRKLIGFSRMNLEHVLSSYVLIITTISQNQFTEVFSIAGVKTQFPGFFHVCQTPFFKMKYLRLVSTVNLVTNGKEGKPDLK